LKGGSGIVRTLRQMRKHAALYLMVLPIAIYFLIFAYYPLLRGFIISLQDYRLIGNRPFVGLDNYLAVVRDPTFWQVVQNTLIISSGILVVGFFVPIVVALALNEVLIAAFKKFAQMVIYLPHLFSWVVVGGIWIYLLSPDRGIVNAFIELLGGDPVSFLSRGDLARPIMILLPVWKDMGFNAILYLAAIVGISPHLYEAARIDGAGRWQQMRFVTLPQLVPTMKVVLLLSLMGVLRIFDEIFLLRNGAIQREVDVIMTYVYDKGILQFKLGFATAATFLVILGTIVLVAVARKATRFDLED
jgi:putative aldouronate transport system permease protein